MARCKQSSTRPPNCNFLCLILVTRMKEIQRIYVCIHVRGLFAFSAFHAILFFRKSTFGHFFLLPLSFFFFLISLFSIFSKGLLLFRIGGLARSNYLCSKKKMSVFLLVRPIVFFQLQFYKLFKLFQNYSRVNLLLSIDLYHPCHFRPSYIYCAQNLLRLHYFSRRNI